jgi:hypothetical protein
MINRDLQSGRWFWAGPFLVALTALLALLSMPSGPSSHPVWDALLASVILLCGAGLYHHWHAVKPSPGRDRR